MWWPFKREQPVEKRSAATGFTGEIMQMRAAYISGARGLAELTATAQSCIALWENGLSMAAIDGTDLLTRRTMALLARSLALRGEALFLIRDTGLVPCADWDLSTVDGKPTAYRVSISEAGGGRSETALAGEVLHVRIGSDPAAPYAGQAPLKRASLTAGLLSTLETALAEVYEFAPIGSQIVPFPESGEVDMETLGRGFRGRRGRVLLRESMAVVAAGGPRPDSDWKPADTTPDLSRSMTSETWAASRNAICGVFGILPSLFDPALTGPQTREIQRHLAQWTLQPTAELVAEEASEKLGSPVAIDMMGPTQSFDAGNSARAVGTIVEAMARAKEAGLAPGDFAAAMKLVDWGANGEAA